MQDEAGRSPDIYYDLNLKTSWSFASPSGIEACRNCYNEYNKQLSFTFLVLNVDDGVIETEAYGSTLSRPVVTFHEPRNPTNDETYQDGFVHFLNPFRKTETENFGQQMLKIRGQTRLAKWYNN